MRTIIVISLFCNLSVYAYTPDRAMLERQKQTRAIVAQMLSNIANERSNKKDVKCKKREAQAPIIQDEKKNEEIKKKAFLEMISKQPKPEFDEFAFYKFLKENGMLSKTDDYSKWRESPEYNEWGKLKDRPKEKQENQNRFLERIRKISIEKPTKKDHIEEEENDKK